MPISFRFKGHYLDVWHIQNTRLTRGFLQQLATHRLLPVYQWAVCVPIGCVVNKPPSKTVCKVESEGESHLILNIMKDIKIDTFSYRHKCSIKKGLEGMKDGGCVNNGQTKLPLVENLKKVTVSLKRRSKMAYTVTRMTSSKYISAEPRFFMLQLYISPPARRPSPSHPPHPAKGLVMSIWRGMWYDTFCTDLNMIHILM